MRRRWLRISLLVGVVGLLVPSGMLLGGLWFVQSDTFRDDALPELIAQVEATAGIEIEYGALHIDPTEGLGFEDVSIRSARPPIQWSLQAKTMRAQYSLDEILSERLVIEALELKGARINLVLPPTSAVAEPASAVVAVPLSPTGAVEALHAALMDIPVEVDVRSADLGIDLIEVSTAPGEVPSQTAELSALRFQAKGLVESGRVSGEFRVQLGESAEKPAPIHLVLSRSAPSEEVRFSIYQVGRVKVELEAKSDSVQMALPELNLSTSITALEYGLKSEESTRGVEAVTLTQDFSGDFSWRHHLSAELPALSDVKALARAVLDETEASAAIDFSTDTLRLADYVRGESEEAPVRDVETTVDAQVSTTLKLHEGAMRFGATERGAALTVSKMRYRDIHHTVSLDSMKFEPSGGVEFPVDTLVMVDPKELAAHVGANLGARLGLKGFRLASDGTLPVRSAELSSELEFSAQQADGKLELSMVSESQAKTPKLGASTKALAVRGKLEASERYTDFSASGAMDVAGARALSAMGTLGLEGAETVRMDAQAVIYTPVFMSQFPQYADGLRPLGVGTVRGSIATRLPLRDSLEKTFQPGVIETLPVSGSLSALIEGESRALDGEEVTLSIGYPIEASGTFTHTRERSEGRFDVSLVSVRTPDALVRSPTFQIAPSLAGQSATASLEFEFPGVETPKLRRSVAMAGQGSMEVDLATLGATWDVRGGISGMAETHFRGTLVDTPGRFDIVGSMDVREIDALIDELPPTSPFPANAPARLTADYRLGVSHAGRTIEEVDAETVRAGSVELSMVGTLEPRAPAKELAEHVVGLWPEPMSLDVNVVVKDEQAKVVGVAKTARLEAVGQGVVHGFEANLEATVPVSMPTQASMSLSGMLGRLEPNAAVVVVEGLDAHLSEISYQLDLQTLPEQGNRMVAMRAGSRDGAWMFTAEGEGDDALEQARFDAVLEAKLPSHAKIEAEGIDVEGKGRVIAPVEVIVVGGREVVVIGKMHFDGVDVVQPAQAIYGLNGTMELNQSLVLPEEGSKPRWSYIETVNPFKRVDTHKVQPYLHARQSLSFDRAEADGRAVGPFFGEVTWTQNLLSFANVDLELFGGVFVGESFVNLHGDHLQVGMLGRLSEFDTSLLNPGREAGGSESHEIFARIASIYDINRSLAEGRLDVDRLEPEALINFMNVVDPTGENAAFNKARMALQIAHPESVRLRLDQGYADLAIEIGGATPLTIVASHLPLRSILHEYGTDFQEKIRKVVPQ